MERFKFDKIDLEGAYLISAFHSGDERGELVKDYNSDIFESQGIRHNLKETFYTISKKGVIRAIHFQTGKQQAKLVRCISGKIYDVIVDLRPDSITFGQWKGFYLSGNEYNEILVPEFFGHGYLVIEDSIVSYKCAEVFYEEGDSGIVYNDSSINISWPFELINGKDNLIISKKDKNLMGFKDYINKIGQGVL